MEYRNLGRSGLKVSEVALGSWLTFGAAVADKTAVRCIHRAYELGINFFDTANAYNRGAAEDVLGKALAEFPRDTLVIATKVFFPMGKAPNQRGLSRKHVMEQAEASLKRLRTDYVDLYQAHRFDEHTPTDETLRAFDDLVRQGKVLYVGTSSFSAEQIIQAHALAERMNLDRTVSNQPIYNMFRRGIEKDIVPACEKLGVGQVVFSPLAQGVLTGKYCGGERPADSRAASSKSEVSINKYMTEEMLGRVELLGAIAADLGMSTAQLALAWCLRLENVSSVICGATKVAHVEDNAAAAGKKIPEDALRKIEDILS